MKTITKLALLSTFIPHLVSAAECNGSAPLRPNMELVKLTPELDKQADAINAWWAEGRNDLEPSDAIMKRQEKIGAVYSEFESKQKKFYSELSCTVSSRKKCTSTSRERNSCSVPVSPPSEHTQFDGTKITTIGDNYDLRPTLATNGSINYTVTKIGAGTNTGGFDAPVFYTQEAVSQFVAKDMELIRQYFQAKVAVSGPAHQIVANTTATIDKCANLANDISKLSDLFKTYNLTENQYQSAVDATIRACN